MHHLSSDLAPNYNSPSELRAFLDTKGLGMRKKYGQNFLINPNTRQKLLDALEIKENDKIWEIGPGLGAMTAGLLDRGAKVNAFEIDPGFSKILTELFGENEKFSLVEGDVLKTWPKVNTDLDMGTEISLFGNLPYNIAAILLADFIEKKMFFKKIVVTVQLETAMRLTAKPGTRDYSSITVLCSSFYKPRPLMIIKPASFFPVPRVDSQGLRLDLLNKNKEMPKYFGPLLRSLFSSRRKTIQNNLISFASSLKLKDGLLASDAAAEVLKQVGIVANLRAETLAPEQFVLLAEIIGELTANDK